MSDTDPIFRLLVVPGVTIDKWSRMWSERLPGVELQIVTAEAAEAAELLAADVDAGLVRLPVAREIVDAITLYSEQTVVVVPRDHFVAAADEVTLADLAEDAVLRPLDEVVSLPGAVGTERPATTADAFALVAAGVGVLLVPQSIARLHHRRDLTHRVVTDAPTSSVALAWTRDRYDDLVEEMIGIVRGRTANSTRGPNPAPVPAAKRTPRPAPGRAAKSATRKPPRGRGR